MRTKDEEAVDMAGRHYQVEEGMRQIYRVTGTAEEEERPGEPYKLLEVHALTVPMGIMPLRFGPMPEAGFHHPCVIIEITPEEYQMLQDRELELPNGWKVGEPIPNPFAETAR